MKEGRTMRAHDEARLHAYYDGELSGFTRWRFEWTLRNTPELQRELSGLHSLSTLIQEQDATAPGPDLWDRIALGLPAADAVRNDPQAARDTGERSALWWLKPLGALAATAAVAVFAMYPTAVPEVSGTGSVVRWIDTGERGVVVLEDRADSTVIWVMDDVIEGASMGGRSDLV